MDQRNFRVEAWNKKGQGIVVHDLTFGQARRLVRRKVAAKRWDYATVGLVKPGVIRRVGKIFTKGDAR